MFPQNKKQLELDTAKFEASALQVEAGRPLTLRSSDGQVCLQVSLVHNEFVLECLSGGLRLRASQAVQLEAPRIELNASGDLQLRAGGDLNLEAGGQVQVQAQTLHLEASTGDALLIANDDVRIDGERIRMNA